MEDDEMTFDTVPDAHPEPARKRLSRLKRANAPAERAAAAADHSTPSAARNTTPRALSDRTNISVGPEQTAHSQPPLSPTRPASEPSASPSKSLEGSPGSDDEGSKHPEQSAAENDYWDSEDELEVELTRRERAEGFHADSAASSEGKSPQHAQDSDSDADSPAKSGSPETYEGLNSQTQRVLRDSAKRDAIGQGQAIQRQPLSGVLGKILSRKDAIAMRAPVVPVRPPKQGRPTQASTSGLAARLHEQASKLVGEAEEAEDEDLLVLSDGESNQGTAQEDGVLADASLALKQAKEFVAHHKTNPPHQNRLGLPVGAAGSAPQDDTQEMGFDSIPFEEPELFRVRIGLQAGLSVTNKEQSSLDLTLDSQDLADASLEQDDSMEEAAAQPMAGARSGASHAQDDAAETKGSTSVGGKEAGDDVNRTSSSGQGVADEEEDNEPVGQESADGDVSPSANASEDEDEQSSAAGEEEEREDEEEEQEADSPLQSGSESLGAEADADSQPEPGGAAWRHQAGQQQLQMKPAKPLRNEFVDEEAEMSEDEGHSQAGSDEDEDDDADLEDLIGQERDKAGDERQRAKLHQQWLEQQDAQQVAQLLEGVRNGFRRKRAGDLLDENVGTDQDTRKRRACRDADEDSVLSDEEEDRLAGLLHANDDDSDDAGLDEHEKQQLKHAHVLKGSTMDEPIGSIDLDAGSQEILALLSSASQANSQGGHSSKPPALLLHMPGSHVVPTVQKATFMGRSVPAFTGARGASQMGSRSYVFGKDDSNSAAPPTDGPCSSAAITGPTSFSGLESMLGDTSNRPGSMTAPSRESKEGSRKPSLLGRLAGKGNTHSHAAGSMSANDLQNALASSFGVRAAARANKAMSRK